ncbi:MAG: hypothetical protein INF88_12730 [Roseomonas sp.]|nr:hypothetical protein [Roseomonas sp.]
MNNDQLLNQLTQQAVEARRLMLGRLLYNRLQGIVSYGPLKGFRLNEQQVWGQGDLGPKLLGLYEQEVLERIAAKGKKWDCVINLGAGDGYYGVGLVKSGLAARSFCFEQKDEGQAAIKHAADTNGVADRVSILGRADADFLNNPALHGIDLSHTLIIIDIEGGEFSLLTANLLKRLKDAELIVELHGRFIATNPNPEAAFLQRLAQYFRCDLFSMGQRDPSTITELSMLGDSDRWLLCSEGRPFLMRWVHCHPISRQVVSHG